MGLAIMLVASNERIFKRWHTI